jgi:transketolase
MAELLYQRDVYGQTLVELGTSNQNIVVLDADLSGSTRTSVFAKAFPDRFFNIGIAEQDMMGVASGLAAAARPSSPRHSRCSPPAAPGTR